MPLLLLLLISVLQWAVVLVTIEFADLATNISFDPTMVLYGNLQIVIILFVYDFIKKYIRF